MARGFQVYLMMSFLLVMTAVPALCARSNSGSSSPASSIGSPDFVDVAAGAHPLPAHPSSAPPFFPYNAEHYTVRPSNRPPDSRETTQTFSPPRRPAPRPDQAGPSTSRHGQTAVSPPRWAYHPSDPADWTQMRLSPQRNSPGRGSSPSSRHSSPSRHSPAQRASPPRRHSSRPIDVIPGRGPLQFPLNLPPGHVYRIPRERSGGGSRAKKAFRKFGGCFGGKGSDCD